MIAPTHRKASKISNKRLPVLLAFAKPIGEGTARLHRAEPSDHTLAKEAERNG